MQTEFASKVALLCALALVCVAMPILRLVPWRLGRVRLTLAGAAGAAVYALALVFASGTVPSSAARVLPPGQLPQIVIVASPGVQSQLTMPTAKLIAHDFVGLVPTHGNDRLSLHLEPGEGQSPPIAVAQLAGRTYRLHQAGNRWVLGTGVQPPTTQAAPTGPALRGYRLTDVAQQVGIDFRQGSFRYGVTNDPAAMMGGGVCWIDYNGDGWLDLFAVNSYADDNLPSWQEHGGLPTSRLYRNDHGRFTDVTKKAGLVYPTRGEGCVAADLNGDGRTDLFVTTATDDVLFWNDGDGTLT